MLRILLAALVGAAAAFADNLMGIHFTSTLASLVHKLMYMGFGGLIIILFSRKPSIQ